MSTERQNEANRQNAQKSTGPSTPEGRAAVSLNGLKYGLYAETLILPGEDPAEFEALLDRFHTEHQPATPTEEAFVSQIVMATWRRARIQRMEVAFYKNDHRNSMQCDDWFRKLDDNGRLALTNQHDADRKRVLDSFSRQEARLDRAIKSAVHELRLCRAERAQANLARNNPVPDSPENKETSERSKDPSASKIGFGFQVDTAQSDSPPNPTPKPPPSADK